MDAQLNAMEPATEVAPKVLIVDDEPIVRSTLGRIVTKMGCECHFAACTDEAIAQLSEIRFSLVLADINMPGPSGLDLALMIGVQHPGVAVVVISSLDDPHVGEVAIEYGAVGYLTKPFKNTDVMSMVRSALRWRHVAELQRSRIVEMGESLVQHAAEVQRLAEALRQSQSPAVEEGFVQSLARATQLKDDEPANHLYRLGRIVELVAGGMGLEAAQCERLRVASMTHDVGKVAVPDAILLKRGKLTADEWRIMKSHATQGYAILSSTSVRFAAAGRTGAAELFDLAASVALTHHERLDGSGYPAGLQGSQIPIEGRIVAVADVLDSMTHRRVYREALSVDTAMEFIRTNAGTLFDAEVVRVLVERLDDVLELMEQYADVEAAAEVQPVLVER
jgi:putative two-component system response regulator